MAVTGMEFLQLFHYFYVLGCKDIKHPNVLIYAGEDVVCMLQSLGWAAVDLGYSIRWYGCRHLPSIEFSGILAAYRGCLSSFSLGWGVGKDIN